MSSSTPLQTRTNRFLRAGEIGAVALALFMLLPVIFPGEVIETWMRVIGSIFALSWLASLAVLFIYRKTDEFTRSIWYSSTSTAFIVAVLWFVFGGAIEALIEYGLYLYNGIGRRLNIVDSWIGILPLVSFYAAIFVNRYIAR